jgi:hypothetical protein
MQPVSLQPMLSSFHIHLVLLTLAVQEELAVVQLASPAYFISPENFPGVQHFEASIVAVI